MTKDDLKIFTKIPDIKTKNLLLRRITQNDLYDVFDYASDPKVSEFLLWRPHPNLDYTKRYLACIAALYKKGKFYDWGVEYGGKMIGTCGFTSFDVDNNSAQIGYVLNQNYWRRGFASECIEALLKFGFGYLNLERIEARYLIENVGSVKVAQKCKMEKEGVLKNAIYCKGRYRTVGICAITKEDFFKKQSTRL